MIKPTIPDLQIKETESLQYDLRRMLFPGGASIYVYRLDEFYENCDWNKIDTKRLAFITECHLAINSFDSLVTRRSVFGILKAFVAWCDKNNIALILSKDRFKQLYLEFDDYTYKRVIKGEICLGTAQNYLAILSVLADKIFSFSSVTQGSGLTVHSRCVKSNKFHAKKAVSPAAEKQSFKDTEALGHYCVDVCKALTTKNLLASLPIVYTSETTTQSYIFPWDMKPFSELSRMSKKEFFRNTKKYELRRKATTIISSKSRLTLAKLRVRAELMIFIFQTGINLSQAINLKRQPFKYKSSGETDLIVSAFKGRARHNVNFKIFKNYKNWFKAYLAFCDEHFPNDPYLFPAINTDANRKLCDDNFENFKTYLKVHGIPWVSPSVIRNTRVNFILRASGDPERTAELHQHGVMTMKKHYHLPSQQRSATALTTFWRDLPVNQIKGGCDMQPQAKNDKPSNVVDPDCIHPSGCLWCEKHRDIESLDYVWSLASFKHLKAIEAAQLKTNEISPDQTINRLKEKLEAFKDIHTDWVVESMDRIEEGSYHPTWKSIIDFTEAK